MTFEAIVPGAPPEARVTWDFGDGATTGAATPSHVFPGPGTWDVTLAVGVGTEAAAATRAVTVTEVGSTEPCEAGPTVACLQDGRFRVTVDWRDFEGDTGPGTVVTSSSDSALLWFFEPDNWELMVKVLDGCALNQRFWVFSAATTSVEYTLRVIDTATGEDWAYQNPSGVAAPAITDTDAFATCP